MARRSSIILVALLFLAKWTQAEDIFRQTRLGEVRGKKLFLMNTVVEEYRGVPYAEPPVGDLRFKPPVARASWDGSFDATTRLTACSQPIRDSDPPQDQAVSFTEDCLNLNIWTPASENASDLPVMVWIHGGAFTYGSASFANSNGSCLAAKSGCVVVAINFRLGVLGFLNANSPDAPGNMGLLDQVMALKWVRDNIAGFGGDPSMVTIFGGSTGSQSVNAHIFSPMSKGLFKRAIMASGALSTINSVVDTMRKGNYVANKIGCSENAEDLETNPQKIVQCLRLKPVEELLGLGNMGFFPTYHDQLLPKAASVARERGFFNNIDVLIGSTSDEGGDWIFRSKSQLLTERLEEMDQDSFNHSLKELVYYGPRPVPPEMHDYYVRLASPSDRTALRRVHIDYVSDRYFNCPIHLFASTHSRKKNAVYRYIFGHKYSKASIPQWMGVPHGQDLRYQMALPLLNNDDYASVDQAVSELVVQVLASFAKNGIPELPNGDAWPKYTEVEPMSVFLAYENITTIHGFRLSECEQWIKYF